MTRRFKKPAARELTVVHNCHHFQESTQSTPGKGSMVAVRFKKNYDYDALLYLCIGLPGR